MEAVVVVIMDTCSIGRDGVGGGNEGKMKLLHASNIIQRNFMLASDRWVAWVEVDLSVTGDSSGGGGDSGGRGSEEEGECYLYKQNVICCRVNGFHLSFH